MKFMPLEFCNKCEYIRIGNCKEPSKNVAVIDGEGIILCSNPKCDDDLDLRIIERAKINRPNVVIPDWCPLDGDNWTTTEKQEDGGER